MPFSISAAFKQARHAQSGAVAVEFALMAIPLMSVLLLAIDLHGNDRTFKRLDATAYEAVTRLRDGSIWASGHTLSSARERLICAQAPELACPSIAVSLAPLNSTFRLRTTDVRGAIWCPGAAHEGLVFQVAYPVPFLTRLWAGDLESRKPYYVASFALRAPQGSPTQVC